MSLIDLHRGGFDEGRTVVTELDTEGFGLRFSVLKLAAGAEHAVQAPHETAWLMMQGDLQVAADGLRAEFHRRSLFDDLPHTLHAPRGAKVTLVAQSEVELLCFEVDNDETFATRVLGPSAVRNERRGEGAHHDASFRFVRTILDDEAGPPAAKLVLGEVVNMPGRWSSYPPHHHPQPEIYHYRFSDPRGYGHAEQGERVYKVRPNDTLLIPPGEDHSQCAAPGYGMWYAWAIRHLDDRRYTVPEFTEDHRWLMEPGAEGWWPRGEG